MPFQAARLDEPLAVARAELVLTDDDLHPLGKPGHEYSVIWKYARVFLKLDWEKGERAEIAVDLLPLTPRQRQSHRTRIARSAAKQRSRFDPISFVHRSSLSLAGKDDDMDLEQSVSSQVLAERLVELENAFQLQVLVRVEARGKERARWLMEQFVACFDQFTGRNSFEVHGYNLFVAFLTSADLPIFRQFFDYRCRTGFFLPMRRRVVSATEVAPFFGPLAWGGGMAPPDAFILRLHGGPTGPENEMFDYAPDRLPCGLVFSRTEGTAITAVNLADHKLSFTGGRAGSGKTEWAMNEFVHLARSGQGTLMLTPHPSTLERMRPYLTPAADRVVEINLANDPAEVPGWNPFNVEGNSRLIMSRANMMMAAISSMLKLGYPRDEIRHDRQEAALRVAINSLLELGMHLPEGLTPTIFQIPTIILDENWRRAIMPFLTQQSRRFWLQRFRKPQEDSYGPVVTMLERLRNWPAATAMLSAPRNTYNIREAMDQGKAVMICYAGFSQRERLVANLMNFDLFHLAMGRTYAPLEQLMPFYPMIDHVEMFDGASDNHYAEIIEASLQYKVYPHFLSERPAALKPAMRQVIMSNKTRLASGVVDPESIEMIRGDWGKLIYDDTELSTLDQYSFLVSHVGTKGHTVLPYQITTVPLGYMWRHCRDVAGVPDYMEMVKRNSGSFSVEENIAELEVLEERIRRWAMETSRPSLTGPGAPVIELASRTTEPARRNDDPED